MGLSDAEPPERVVRRARSRSRPRGSVPTCEATVSAAGTGQVAIPADGAVLVATGGDAAKLEAEAPPDTQVTVRLILPDAWGSVVSAVGGGPLLVRGGRPLFTTGENFDPTELAARQPRVAVGQLEDGRVVLVAVDGGRPGYSVGMTSYELAKTMAAPRRGHGRRRSSTAATSPPPSTARW